MGKFQGKDRRTPARHGQGQSKDPLIELLSLLQAIQSQ
jgi:hypothetical protein